ncbi:hypothetical protein [Streptomyces sp. NPDC097981]|uniref:hypothetical protein n=1 Tax=Streptomyces sp. NPDC097981 TaxID=3155428 RepID=UPI003321AA01
MQRICVIGGSRYFEVYDPATAVLPAVPPGTPGTPVPEEIVDPAAWLVAMGLPRHDDAYLEAHYAERYEEPADLLP